MTGTVDPGSPGTPTPTPTPAAAPTWFSTFSADDQTYLQTKGLDKVDAPTAAVKLMEFHRGAERLLGVPADQLIKLTDLNDTEAAKKVWQRLGAPADPKEYTFEGIDFGSPERTVKYAEELRAAAAEVNAPKAFADAFAKRVAKIEADGRSSAAAERTAAIGAEQAKLQEDWGTPDSDKFKANMAMADRAAATLGVDAAAAKALKDGLGGAFVARMFRDLATKLGEAAYIASPNNNDPNALMTKDAAVTERLNLFGVDGQGRMVPGKGDPALRAKLMAKDAAVTKQYQNLNALIIGTL